MITKQGIMRQHSEAKTVHMGKNIVSFVLSGDETGGFYSLTEFTLAAPPVPGPPVHIHGTGDEAAYVLEGNLEFLLGANRSRSLPVRLSSFLKVCGTMFLTWDRGQSKYL
jgi:quercetin dioxygenase-like cupin family protein